MFPSHTHRGNSPGFWGWGSALDSNWVVFDMTVICLGNGKASQGRSKFRCNILCFPWPCLGFTWLTYYLHVHSSITCICSSQCKRSFPGAPLSERFQWKPSCHNILYSWLTIAGYSCIIHHVPVLYLPAMSLHNSGNYLVEGCCQGWTTSWLVITEYGKKSGENGENPVISCLLQLWACISLSKNLSSTIPYLWEGP